MSRVELPLSLLDRVLGGGPAGRMDEALADRLERALRRVEPDPLFKRRLRGSILNYHVAAREGHLRSARPRRQMSVIGRSVLYASVVLALGVGAAGAAAQSSVPGDALFAVKLRLEEVRMKIAPPSVRDQLASIALGERIAELERLAIAGKWDQVTAAAGRVTAAEALVSVEPDQALTPQAASAAHAVEVLQAVLAKAPATARPGLENALQASTRAAAAGEARGHRNSKDAAAPKTTGGAAHPTHPPQAKDGKDKRHAPAPN